MWPNKLRYRLRCAWAAFRYGGSWHHQSVGPSHIPLFAVIYDDPSAGRCDTETFYEAFLSPPEAHERFSEAFPKLTTTGEDGANARLVLILGPIGQYGETA